MTVTIRQASTTAIDPIVEGYEWLFSEPGAPPDGWDPERAGQEIRKAIDSDRSTFFIAISSEDGTLAGFCSAYLDVHSIRYGRRCWVEDLAVAPKMRSRGIGDDLLASAESWARSRGATHLELDTGVKRTDARRFYESRNPQYETVCYGWRLKP